MGEPEQKQGTETVTQEEAKAIFGLGASPKEGEATPDTGDENAPAETGESEPQQETAEGQESQSDSLPPDAAKFVLGGREFASKDEAERSVKELAGAYTREHEELLALRAAIQARRQEPQVEAKPQTVQEKWSKADPKAFLDGLDKNPFGTVGEVSIEHLRSSGERDRIVADAVEKARKEVMESLYPQLNFVSQMQTISEIEGLRAEYPGAFTPEIQEQVMRVVGQPGNRATPKDVFFDIVARRLPALTQRQVAGKAVADGKRRSAEAGANATKPSGTRAGRPVPPPQDPTGAFFGANRKIDRTLGT